MVLADDSVLDSRGHMGGTDVPEEVVWEVALEAKKAVRARQVT